MTWRIQAWQAGDHVPSETEFDEGESIERESDKSEPDPFMATYGGERRQRIVFPKALASPTVLWGSSPYGAHVHQEPRQYPSRPATTTGRATSATPPTPRPSQPAGGGGHQSLDIGAFMATVLQAQTENQLAIAAASHNNMVAFHTETAQATAWTVSPLQQLLPSPGGAIWTHLPTSPAHTGLTKRP
jgi:hypothetical protein